MDPVSVTAAHDDAARLRAYGAARQRLGEWFAGAQALALLRAALDAGLLDAARTPGTPADLAAAARLDPARAADLCRALDAHGILDRAGETYRLAPDFAALVDPDAPQSLAAGLAYEDATARLLAGAAAPGAAWATLPPDDLLALARGAAFRPGAALARAVFDAVAAAFPEAAAAWEAGGRHLELGCGVGGAVLNLLLRYPALRAVGVDREAALLGEAARTAAALGVADRAEWRAADARDLRDEAAFDTVQWSQFFFPAGARAATLAAAYRALKPGGYLYMPLLPAPPAGDEAARAVPGRLYAGARVVWGGWGIPVLDAEELRAEVAAAGFAVVRVADTPVARRLLARRPPD